ncbi:MAG: elongation factor 4 [Candidatus Kerfeldbacteria bacterium RIFCSPHIGHO2_12_FULL_48_17]|uniref:Elongation factor 4 n=1 Tax=Candidatus Kerfeldbacteria bacterium RIFCSPHIGHO2_12_FULL_48_17 TaxID=1798542 RepID=A0A1G2AY75_9BACT|nr:MAG: elongation factor 4 [Candidatus Kerfeldbacteria bacterium RIFCSPHIGHO2_12_FULL_48_17]
MPINQAHIRNFCIIAHIDHGKSTLADRLLEFTGTIDKRAMKDQVLDQMDIERERGITIKLQPVRMEYTYRGEKYILNLIDTPGHVDFTYEVSRSLQACEGALLVVDATQGIEAQTLANLYLAFDQNLEIIPVVNKIDLPAADPDKVSHEIMKLIGCKKEDIILASGKVGTGVADILKAVIERIAAPTGNHDAPSRALIFDSVYDDYRGVITYLRMVDGSIKKGEELLLMAQKNPTQALDTGFFKPQLVSTPQLQTGEIGYIVTGFKDIEAARVGDTVTAKATGKQAHKALPGYKQVKPMVYAGIFCKDGSDYPDLKKAMAKLKLNDSSLQYEVENSPALGFGFRCGFLGLLHMEVVQERLKREANLDVMVTAPSVEYKVTLSSGEKVAVTSPLEMPDPSTIQKIEEPVAKVDIVTPTEYIGAIMQLVKEKKGNPTGNEMEYLDELRVILHYEVPLSGVVSDFHDRLKNVSAGYASMNYELSGWKEADVVRLDILVAGDITEPLSSMVYRDSAFYVGRKIVAALKDILPRQMFEVRLQAAIGAKIIASERISAMRKDVTAKLYGGDVTRKRKLLEKQKKGKQRMKTQGKVDIPQEAFLTILKK